MKQKFHKLYTDISGNTIGFLTYEYGKGRQSLYIQGGVHGGEITYFIFKKLNEFLLKNEKLLKKKILLAPIINPVAWSQRIYYYTVGKFDLYKGTDWNRSYPGGDTSLSARNSKIVFNIAKEYDLILDLHTARISKPYTIFTDKQSLSTIRTLGFSYNQFIDLANPANSKYKGIISDAVNNLNKQGIVIECGSHDNFDLESIEIVFQSIKRFIYKSGIIVSKKHFICPETKIFDKIDVIYSPISGFIKYLKYPREEIKKNDILCEIYPSNLLDKVTKIKTPYNGIMFELAKTHIVWTGDELIKIIDKKNLKY